MLLPKKVKHRKWHRLGKRHTGVATRSNSVAFGQFGLLSQSHAWVSSRQIEAARRVLTRYIKRGGKVWIRIFPDRPVTQKGAGIPMGGGKGAPDYFVCTVKPGAVLFEMAGISEAQAKEALVNAAHKLPLKGKFLKRV